MKKTSRLTDDPMGSAIYDYFTKGTAGQLVVHSSMFDDDEIPVEDLFRSFEEMPELEQTALKMCRGRVLDVGAGAGCHSVALQNMGLQTVAVDISGLSVEVMKMRHLDARRIDFYDCNFTEKFDTVLMLMNGTGIIGRLENTEAFFNRLRQLLNPKGCVLIDSSDLRYLYEEEDGSLMIDLADDYYGLVDYQMEYLGSVGETFDWLYLDFETLSYYAQEYGFRAELVAEGEHYDYLAALYLCESR